MEREILFRAKRTDTSAWVYGYYCKHIKRQVCPMGDELKPEDIAHLIIDDGFADWNMPRSLQAYDIEPDTVGQYAGLRDEKCNESFEHDIVKCHFTNTEKSEHIGVVVFRNGKYQAQIKTGETGAFYVPLADGIPRLPQDKSMYMDWFEVIGNIHDNPELLEVT